jgi:hypothetical protein
MQVKRKDAIFLGGSIIFLLVAITLTRTSLQKIQNAGISTEEYQNKAAMNIVQQPDQQSAWIASLDDQYATIFGDTASGVVGIYETQDECDFDKNQFHNFVALMETKLKDVRLKCDYSLIPDGLREEDKSRVNELLATAREMFPNLLIPAVYKKSDNSRRALEPVFSNQECADQLDLLKSTHVSGGLSLPDYEFVCEGWQGIVSINPQNNSSQQKQTPAPESKGKVKWAVHATETSTGEIWEYDEKFDSKSDCEVGKEKRLNGLGEVGSQYQLDQFKDFRCEEIWWEED